MSDYNPYSEPSNADDVILGTGRGSIKMSVLLESLGGEHGGTTISGVTGLPAELERIEALAKKFDWINVVTEYGAKGTGATGTDDTAAIQNAINAITDTRRTVYIPDGTYNITAANPYSGSSSDGSLRLQSNMQLIMGRNAILKVIPNDRSNHDVLRIRGVDNVDIVGGILQGDRADHFGDTSTGSQQGMGVWIEGANNVRIINLVAKDFWGDGIYTKYHSTLGNSTNIYVNGYHAINNRRQGISICAVNRMTVTNSIFETTQGIPLASSGIDIEPELGGTVNEVTISGCVFNGNRVGFTGLGLATASLVGNTFKNNTDQNIYLGSASQGYTVTGNVCYGSANGIYLNFAVDNVVSDNTVFSSTSHGIHVLNQCFRNIINNNRVHAAGGYGILVSAAADNVIDGNTITNSTNSGINVTGSNTNNHGNIVSNNKCLNNTQNGIYMFDGIYNSVVGNTCNSNGLSGIRVTDADSVQLSANSCTENSQTTNIATDNIYITGTGSDLSIIGNYCRAGSKTNKPRYGLRIEDNTITSSYVFGNDLRGGGATGDYSNLAGTSTIEPYRYLTAAPTTSASFIGQFVVDTTNKKMYVAVSVGSGAADWVTCMPWRPGATNAAPTANANFIGEYFIDTTARKVYMATAVGTGASDWSLLN